MFKQKMMKFIIKNNQRKNDIMKEEIKELTTETDLRENRLRQVSEAQRALANQDYDLATQHLWNIMSTVDKESNPRKQMDEVLEKIRVHYRERVKEKDRLADNMQVLDGNDFQIGYSSKIEMRTAQEFYDGIMDILVRWELIK